MYGFVNQALQDLVLRESSFGTWEEILKKANIDLGETGEFNQRRIYDDQNTFDLLRVASEVLGLSHNVILEKFGEIFFEYCQNSGYEKMLDSLGSNLKDFFNSLDALHEHLLYIFPGMRAPSFHAKDNPDGNGLEILYYSERSGLEYMVVGVVKAVAREVYNTKVNIEVAVPTNQEKTWSKIIVTPENYEDMIHLKQHDEQIQKIEQKLELVTLGSRISSQTFCQACPFHILFDNEMVIYQAGISLLRVLPSIKVGETKVGEMFECIRPHISLTFDNILQFINKVYVVKTKEGLLDSATLTTVSEDDVGTLDFPTMRFRGQMMYLPECDSIMFLCSPSVLNLDGLNEIGLYLSDIPIHDATRDLILLSEQHNAESRLSQRLEILTDKLQQTSRELQQEQQLTDRLLYSILPSSVANDLRLKRPVMAKKYEIVTIMFSGIVDFTNYCNQSSEPMEIVELLNDTYIRFDALADKNNEVFKVETVGDKYMAVSGLPTKCTNHTANIANLALDMIDIVQEVNAQGRKMQITVGIHSGEVVAGVVGQKKPRYCLFGNTVNLTSRTETTGLRGKINVTEYAYRSLLCQPHDHFVFKKRGPVTMKGKPEPMITYILQRKEHRDVLRTVTCSGL
ncbi:guanylate cyclase soluble subunit beta-1-like [Stylophora pistillata]|uniref:Guanylate cyclase soluble subunit beta-1 n=1 Tax=Stylophora pistillata TaxID=50429 RepID=A0A2B4S0U2_STYPI|nr:guanylate cyclase soluble subunit beta-1-like [Stylophora pistillata]PFX22669.1 Guanylate cyclase soluble subunit beta-1 [Stylophora pistillata]